MRNNQDVLIVTDMAPKSTAACDQHILPEEPELDLNHNEVVDKMRTPVGPKRPSEGGDLNERSRKLIRNCFRHLESNLNVLVIGPRGAGKSSLINSMNMALTQEWTDRARYCPGRNHVIDQCVMYQNRKCRKNHDGKVVFWDTRGFEDIHADDHAVLIIRYVLEGRIPPKCIPCVLLMSKEIIKKRYHKIINTERRIDLVLNVAALDEEPQTRLMSLVQQAIAASKHTSVNKIPVVSVATKSDAMTEAQVQEKMARLHEYSLEHLVEEQRQSNRSSRRKRPSSVPDVPNCAKLVVNYSCELEPWSDESIDPSSVTSSPELDSRLLSLWREIVSRTTGCEDSRKRAFSATNSSKPIGRCLFPFHYSRLRSSSF